MLYLIFGHKGWIGGIFTQYLNSLNINWVGATSRADNYNDSRNEIYKTLNDHSDIRVISFIGRTHGIYNNVQYSTIDYLELPEKLNDNLRDNLYGPLNLANICKELNVHFTYLGTGCIFNGYDKEYTEEDDPDFFGSSYSVVKGYTDKILRNNVLNLRIRMPISSVYNARNFITKITHYDKICSQKNSMTVLDDFIPIFNDMIEKKLIGTFNCTNPGSISHNEILYLYKDIVNNNFTWKNFTLQEQNEIILSKRSNNVLDTSKISAFYPIKNINDSLINVLQSYKNNSYCLLSNV